MHEWKKGDSHLLPERPVEYWNDGMVVGVVE
jgi:hypothetical protein